ncbi:very short patch repair endonuclease [Saccharopolyspora shandongensis]|uniref:very short patch repair endonuclease n=1 Tax=Saccharopolyspora shandongensis TaxID=418495 RepID=UPI00340EAFB1
MSRGSRNVVDRSPPDGFLPWSPVSYRGVVGAERPTRASSGGTRKSMQGNKGRDTKPELALRRAVHALGLRYRVSMRPLPEVRRTADLVFSRAKVAVFLDGCFWHGCPDHHTKSATNAEYWAEKVERNRERDRGTDCLLIEAGWAVIRVWEHEDPTCAAEKVASAVRSRVIRS